jgi:hypothetical protein
MSIIIRYHIDDVSRSYEVEEQLTLQHIFCEQMVAAMALKLIVSCSKTPPTQLPHVTIDIIIV